MRASSVDFEYYMRNDAAKRLREGSEGKEVRFDAEFGSEEGRKVVVSCPRIKNKMPGINGDSATVTLSQSSDILGVGLEDVVEIILEELRLPPPPFPVGPFFNHHFTFQPTDQHHEIRERRHSQGYRLHQMLSR